MHVHTCFALLHVYIHAHRSHFVMELLPSLFHTLHDSKGNIDRSTIQLLANPRNAAHRNIWNDNMQWISAFLSVLSDSELIFWNDLQRLAIQDRQRICFHDLLVWTDYELLTSPDQSSPVIYSYHVAASWTRYRTALHTVLSMTPDWNPHQCNSISYTGDGWWHSTVLFLQRHHVRRIENMDELKADAEAEGFSCIELTTDGRSVFEIIQSVLNVHLLIGVNSAAYNAIFMPIPAAVLEIDAKLGGYYTGAHSSGPQSFLTTHIGYHWLGIHLFLYSIGRRLATGNDPTIAVSVNVTQTALSAMRQKVQQQEAIGCCEVTALDREECRGTWQYVHREHVYLDITNKYNATSVAVQVEDFCTLHTTQKHSTHFAQYRNHTSNLAIRESCFVDIMTELLEHPKEKSLTHMFEARTVGTSGASIARYQSGVQLNGRGSQEHLLKGPGYSDASRTSQHQPAPPLASTTVGTSGASIARYQSDDLWCTVSNACVLDNDAPDLSTCKYSASLTQLAIH